MFPVSGLHSPIPQSLSPVLCFYLSFADLLLSAPIASSTPVPSSTFSSSSSQHLLSSFSHSPHPLHSCRYLILHIHVLFIPRIPHFFLFAFTPFILLVIYFLLTLVISHVFPFSFRLPVLCHFYFLCSVLRHS